MEPAEKIEVSDSERLVRQIAEEVVMPLWEALKGSRRGINTRLLARRGEHLFRNLSKLLETPEGKEDVDLSISQRDVMEVLKVMAARPHFNSVLPPRLVERFDQRTINALLRRGVLIKVEDGYQIKEGS